MTGNKLSIKDYKAIVENQKKEIDYLKHTIENFEFVQRGKCCECCEDAVQDLSDLMIKCMPFEDEYFKGLSYEMIADLAKKSLRLTSENSDLRNKLEDIADLYDASEYAKQIKNIIQKT